jgi:DNA-binding CsgD family transcriptional regulator
LRAFCDGELAADEGRRWLLLAPVVAADLWDDESWYFLSTRHLRIARDAGALSEIPLALNSRVLVHVFDGELAAAASLVEEAQAAKEATGSDLTPLGALALAAWQGREDDADQLFEVTMREVVPRREGIGVTVTYWARAMLANSLGRYDEAFVAARRAAEHRHEPGAANWALAELIEAAARTGQRGDAAEALERLAEMARASGTGWALGVLARSRALVTGGDAAESLHHEAIEQLEHSRVRLELGRARLLYGEWLRREQRRMDARVQLRIAHDMFDRFGAEAFAERARRELQATGETVRKRTVDTSTLLTAQEAQVARLAADGHTNPEIGAQLFISPRTAEYHLHKVFSKLDISSRRQLRGHLESLDPAT